MFDAGIEHAVIAAINIRACRAPLCGKGIARDLYRSGHVAH